MKYKWRIKVNGSRNESLFVDSTQWINFESFKKKYPPFFSIFFKLNFFIRNCINYYTKSKFQNQIDTIIDITDFFFLNFPAIRFRLSKDRHGRHPWNILAYTHFRLS